jgi:hypothetical protein
LVKVIDKALGYITTVQNGMNDLVSKHASKLTMAVGVYTSLTGGAAGSSGDRQTPWYTPPTVQPPQPVAIKSVAALYSKIPAPSAPGGAYVPPPAGTAKYPPGSIARFNVTRGVWSVYAPRSAGLGYGLGYGVYPNMMGLGAEPVVEPPAPGPRVGEELTPEAARAQGATPSTDTERDRPWYKSPWFIGGAVAVVAAGAGGYVLLRRKHRTIS